MECGDSDSIGFSGLVIAELDANIGDREQQPPKKPQLTVLDGQFFEIVGEEISSSTYGRCVLCKPNDVIIKGHGSSSSNFISHLKRRHGDTCLNDYLEHCKAKKKKSSTEFTGASSSQHAQNKQRQSRHVNQIKFSQDLTKFIVHSMVPLKTVEDPYFRAMFDNMSGGAIAPEVFSRRTLTRKIMKLYDEIRNTLKIKLKNVQYCCTTADIWSGRRRSFFGVTCHWISNDFERKSAALACRRFSNAHSYDRIADLLNEIHLEHGIMTTKVVATVTDNGSNFVKAFKTFGVTVFDDENSDSEEFDDGNIEAEETDELFETERTNSQPLLPTHLRCFAHTLHLCATTDMNNCIKKSTNVSRLHFKIIEKCNVLWKATKKPKSAEIVERLLNKTLPRPGITRWNSLYDALRAIIQHKDKYFQLSEELQLSETQILTTTDFIYLEEYIDCSKPLAQAIDILQGEENAYFGIAIPTLISLRIKIQKLLQQPWCHCKYLLEGYVESIDKRFEEYFYFTTIQSKNAAIAAFSHPKFKNAWLSGIHESHRETLLRLFKSEVEKEWNVSEESETSISSPGPSNSTKSNHLDDFFEFGEPSDDYQVASSSELEVLRFFADRKAKRLQSLEKFPAIKRVFMKFNTPLPSSAPVERLFSWATITNQAKSNRLSDKNFERRVVLKANSKFFPEISSF